MSNRYLIAAAVLALASAGLAQAQAPAPVPAVSGPAGVSGDQVVKARQVGMALSGGDFAAIKSAVDHGEDVTKLTFASGAIGRWAAVLPTLFPAGTGSGQVTVRTAAKPEIWSDRAGFEAAAANFGAEAVKLRDLAKKGDKDGFTAQLDVLHKACNACHDKYKVG